MIRVRADPERNTRNATGRKIDLYKDKVEFSIGNNMEPERGFYYHYKHTDDSINNYAYEVLNIAHHSEIKDLDEGALVIYRPIYEARVFRAGKHWVARPLKMFMETVIKDGKEIKRFTKITDPKIISELEKIREEMYQE